MKKILVELTPYPVRISVTAETKEDALEQAKNGVSFSVYESEVSEVSEE